MGISVAAITAVTAVIGLATSAFSTVQQMNAAEDAQRAQEEAGRAQAAQRRAQQRRQRRAQIRQAQIARAEAISQGIGATGQGTSNSTVQGNLSSIQAQLGSNIGFTNSLRENADVIGDAAGEASQARARGQVFGAANQLGQTIFSNAPAIGRNVATGVNRVTGRTVFESSS